MKWEYFVKDIGIEFHPAIGQAEILNHYGKEGWELVSVQGSFAYFKRLDQEYMNKITKAQMGTPPDYKQVYDD